MLTNYLCRKALLMRSHKAAMTEITDRIVRLEQELKKLEVTYGQKTKVGILYPEHFITQ